MQNYKSAVCGEVVDSAAKHGVSSTLGAIQLGTVTALHPTAATLQPFFSPRVGRLLQPALPPPAGSTGQTVSVIPKISYRFSATIPPLFVAFEVRFQRLGWAGGGWPVTWPPLRPPAPKPSTDCPLIVQSKFSNPPN